MARRERTGKTGSDDGTHIVMTICLQVYSVFLGFVEEGWQSCQPPQDALRELMSNLANPSVLRVLGNSAAT